jgi:hypothetical protein
MGLSKAELLQSGSISHQQALVQRLQEDARPKRPKKRVIPGGKRLLEQLDKDMLKSAVYNWIRGTRGFYEVKISFAKNPENFNLKVEKVRDFDIGGDKEIWETHQDGRKYLADIMADIIAKQQLVYIEAKKDGVYVATDVDGTFGPTKEVSKTDVKAQADLINELRTEHIKLHGDEDGSPAFKEPPVLKAGDHVPSDEWEPYIEFIPKRSKQYGY